MHLGFSDKADGFITDNQGLDTNDEIESLCKVDRSPGGTVPNPNAGDPGQPATLLKHMEQVMLQAELNIKLGCYYLRFQD